MTTPQRNYNLDPNQEYTKKSLAELIGVNIKTITKTLQLAGLDTKARSYLGSELLDSQFIMIRSLFEQGRSEEWIKTQYLKVNSAADPGASSEFTQEEADLDLEAIGLSVRENVLEIGFSYAEAAATQMVEHLPVMVFKALERKAHDGTIERAFAKFRNLPTVDVNAHEILGSKFSEEESQMALGSGNLLFRHDDLEDMTEGTNPPMSTPPDSDETDDVPTIE